MAKRLPHGKGQPPNQVHQGPVQEQRSPAIETHHPNSSPGLHGRPAAFHRRRLNTARQKLTSLQRKWNNMPQWQKLAAVSFILLIGGLCLYGAFAPDDDSLDITPTNLNLAGRRRLGHGGSVPRDLSTRNNTALRARIMNVITFSPAASSFYNPKQKHAARVGMTEVLLDLASRNMFHCELEALLNNPAAHGFSTFHIKLFTRDEPFPLHNKYTDDMRVGALMESKENAIIVRTPSLSQGYIYRLVWHEVRHIYLANAHLAAGSILKDSKGEPYLHSNLRTPYNQHGKQTPGVPISDTESRLGDVYSIMVAIQQASTTASKLSNIIKNFSSAQELLTVMINNTTSKINPTDRQLLLKYLRAIGADPLSDSVTRENLLGKTYYPLSDHIYFASITNLVKNNLPKRYLTQLSSLRLGDSIPLDPFIKAKDKDNVDIYLTHITSLFTGEGYIIEFFKYNPSDLFQLIQAPLNDLLARFKDYDDLKKETAYNILEKEAVAEELFGEFPLLYNLFFAGVREDVARVVPTGYPVCLE